MKAGDGGVPTVTDSRNPRVVQNYDEAAVSLLGVAAIFLRRRRLIVVSTLLFSVLAAVITVLFPRSWTATASFVPQSSVAQTASRLSSLASQFGINVGGADGGQNPEFYAELVRSRAILGKVAEDTFNVAGSDEQRGTMGGPVTVQNILNVKGETVALRREAVIRWLQKKAVSVGVGDQTGIVTVSVTTRWPMLSQEIAGRIVDLVNRFNLETRQSQAGAERRFIEERMAETHRELRSAEDTLQRFLQDNRAFENSPELAFQQDRLQREVNMRQQMYTTLTQSYEQARIDEVRNTPVITVIESAETPVKPDSRHGFRNIILGLVFGTFLGVLLAFTMEGLRTGSPEDAEDYAEVAHLWNETKSDLTRVTKRFRRSS